MKLGPLLLEELLSRQLHRRKILRSQAPLEETNQQANFDFGTPIKHHTCSSGQSRWWTKTRCNNTKIGGTPQDRSSATPILQSQNCTVEVNGDYTLIHAGVRQELLSCLTFATFGRSLLFIKVSHSPTQVLDLQVADQATSQKQHPFGYCDTLNKPSLFKLCGGHVLQQ